MTIHGSCAARYSIIINLKTAATAALHLDSTFHPQIVLYINLRTTICAPYKQGNRGKGFT